MDNDRDRDPIEIPCAPALKAPEGSTEIKRVNNECDRVLDSEGDSKSRAIEIPQVYSGKSRDVLSSALSST